MLSRQINRRIIPDITLQPMTTPTPVPTDTPTYTPTLPSIVINEIRVNQPSTDNDEYFELICSTPGSSLARLTYLVIGDNSLASPLGVIESVTDLSSYSLPESDYYFLVAEATFNYPGVTPDVVLSGNGLNFENENVTHLLVADFSGTHGQDLDTDDDGTLDITPWSQVVDAIGLVQTVGSGDRYYGASLGFEDIGPDGTSLPGHVSRCPDGMTWLIGVFEKGIDDSPGDPNICTTPTPVPTSTPTNTPTNTPVVVSVGTMIAVSSGSFIQGSPETEPCRSTNETQFMHSLSRNLAVMETEITRQMWSDLRAVQPSLPVDPSNVAYSPTLSHPVQQNTWYEAVLFANLLSLQNGYTRCYFTNSGLGTPIDATNYTGGSFYCNFAANGYRLASEGEWEYFTRAGTTTPFSCNETNFTASNCGSCTLGTHLTLEQYCVYCANDPGTTVAAGSKPANPWGLKDVHGNVWEWCWDWYDPMYPSLSATDYTGAAWGTHRVMRGGSFDGSAIYCRSARRHTVTPDHRNNTLGFRLVRVSP
ncbi:formylglycine-generating enzyme family protein [bacterium]|nr:formylglycine-generating enzyme family protein [candidate division CSSED10-310 bacterium]